MRSTAAARAALPNRSAASRSLRGEIVAVVAHRMDQIIDDVDARHCRAHRVFVEDIAFDDFDSLETIGNPSGIAGDAAHGVSCGDEHGDEPAADVSRGAGDENVHYAPKRTAESPKMRAGRFGVNPATGAGDATIAGNDIKS